jgi:hypothetical protein
VSNFHSTIQEADNALYQAKPLGKDSFCLCREPILFTAKQGQCWRYGKMKSKLKHIQMAEKKNDNKR